MPDPRLADPLDTTAELETPEHVRFRFRVAGPARRALAYLIDLLLRGALVAVFATLALLGGAGLTELVDGAAVGLLLLVSFLVEWGYYVVCDLTLGGRTPGRRALGLRVVDETGRPLRPGQSLLRNLLRAADFLPFGYALGVLVMARDPRFRRIGDWVAGTMVVLEERIDVLDRIVVSPPPTREELASLPSRLPLTGDELDAIELYLRRAPRLVAARADELAGLVAPEIARRLGVRYRDARRFLGAVYVRAREEGGA